MADASFLQTSFLGGEFSPYMQGRADHKEYRSGLNRLRNAIAVEEGAATRRPGTRVGGLTRGGNQAVLREFHFDQAHSYLMEFTDGFLRFWSGPSVALDAPGKDVLTFDAGTSQIETSTAHGWSTDNYVALYLKTVPVGSVAGASLLLGRQFPILVNDATHFQLMDPLNSSVNADLTTADLTGISLGVARVTEVTTPYTGDKYQSVRVVQDEDTAIVLQGTVKPYQVTQLTEEVGDTFAIFSFAASTFYDGPYLDPPTDGRTLTPSALTGSITLTASSATFASTDVGRMLRLLSEPLDWASGTAYAAGDHVKYDGAYYTALAASTGKVPGTEFDSWAIDPSAALWTWGRITAVADSTHATLALAAADPLGIKAGGDLLYTNAIKTWRLGVYSDTTGWPTCGAFMEGRLWLAGETGNRVDSSMSLDTFWWSPTLKDGTVADNCGISAILKSDNINRALWMLADDQGLLMGTQAGEWLIRASQNNDPLTPTSIQAKRLSKFGSDNVEPRTTPLSKVFVQRNGRNLIEYVRDPQPGSFQGTNLSLKAKHFTESGIEEIAYQALTTPIIWLRNGDGELVGCTYKRDNPFAFDPASFAAWHLHSLGTGRTVASIQSGPSTGGNLDTLSLVTFDAARGIYFVEFLTDIFEQGSTVYDAWFLDGAVTPAGIEEVTVDGNLYLRVYGLGLIVGDTVDVWAAGVDMGSFTVAADGTIDIPVDGTDSLLTSEYLAAAVAGGSFSYFSDFFHKSSRSAYFMSAEDNYTAAMAADWDDGTLSTDIYRVDQTSCGTSFDPVSRKLFYSMTYCTVPGGSTTNTTGHTLWDGRDSIAPAGAWDQRINARLFLMSKDIDTGVVTSYDTYDPTETVPGSVAGDGTWRRFVRECLYGGGNYPLVVDPRTQDVWLHTQSCELYCFRASETYKQLISPFFGVEAVGNLVFPVGLTDDWMYAREDKSAGVLTYHCIPRTVTADEVTADELLAYASYDLPKTATVDKQVSHVVDANDNLYVAHVSYSGTPVTYTLYKFEPPTSAPFGGPVVGGGFTDVTPWAADEGPNLDAVGYTSPGTNVVRPLFLFDLRETDVIVQITKLASWVGGGDASQKNIVSCTYINTSTGDFDHHSAFVHTYMKADWVPATGLSDAAYWMLDFRELNSYLNYHSYTFDEDYTKRWFVFEVSPVVDGVATGDVRSVFVQYQFAYGSAPAVLEVIDEGRWRETYPRYARVYHAGDSVVSGTPDYTDDGVWDDTTQSFWFSGAEDQSLFFLNDAFTVRGGLGDTLSQNPPFLKLTFAPAVLPLCIGVTFETQCQILRAVEPQQAGAQNGPALGKTRRTHQYAALLASTQGISFGTDFSAVRPALFQSPGGTAYAANQLFSGVWWSPLEDDYSFDSMVCWTVTRPYPATVLSLSGFLHTQDR